MPRKRCCGKIDEFPNCYKFISDQTDHHEVMRLGMEEIEAIRLKDMEGHDQKTCAMEMGLTRPTFQRILIAARRKIATALVEGQTIHIGGGNYQMKNRVFECLDCGETWEVEPCSEGGRHGYELACPKCGSMNKTKLVDGQRHACGGAGSHEKHEHNAEGGGCCGGHK
ncbi:MAG: DUF134 domain-containing protein [Eubacteriales bacterium]